MSDELKDLRALSLPFDVDEVDPICHQCVRDQLKKYDKYVDEDGNKASGRFMVPCHGIKKHIIDPIERAAMSDKEAENIAAARDVVSFASKYLFLPDGTPWVARWYQEPVLRCTSKRKVLRISRRTGKCISAKSLIFSENGPITAEELYALKITDRPFVATFNEDTLKTEFAFGLIQRNGRKPVFRLRTKNGRETVVTDNHPFLVRTDIEEAEWKELKDIEIGECIAVPSTYEHLQIQSLEATGERKARLLGYLTGDGGTNYKTTVRFTNFDEAIIEDISDIISDYNCKLNEITEGNYNIIIDDGQMRGPGNYSKGSNKINQIVTEEGLRSLAVDKTVPKSIMRANRKEIANFLGAYWDCDGWCSVGKNTYGRKHPNIEVGAATASKELALNIKHLLLRFGIFSNLKEKKVKYDNGYKIAWQITMAGKDSIEKFRKYIPLRAKKENLEKVYEVIKDKKARIIENEYFWDPVVEISYVGVQETYDLSVPETHTLIADDIISHNTDSVCVDIIYRMYTTRNIKILVAGPQKSQTEELITRIRSFINNNPALKRSVVRDVSAPWYEIKLQNGARLRGFAAGTKGKQEGVSMRSQDADAIYIEEMDYVDPNAIEGAIYPIMQTTPDTALIGFSTPTGFRTPYYSLCEESPHYKEFQYSYKVLPWWKNVEAEKSNFTEEKWTHEYLAEWGDSESGVYKPSYVDRALQNYEYKDQVRNPIWKYTIGTDWNEKHGTEIVVLGHNTHTGMFQVVDSVLVERSEFTQLSGIQKLLDMNKKWRPNFIYIDAGNGSTNYEVIRKKAYENSTKDGDRDTARLLTMLKKYDAGSSLEVKDPVSKQKRRAPAKPFMVHASVRMFEQNRILISSSDNTMEKQLRNYIIDRITPTGTEVYGQMDETIGDHRLDALNLAIVAFHLEFDDLHAPIVMMDVGAAPDPRVMKLKESRKITDARSKDSVIHEPGDRRLEGPDHLEKTWAEKQVFGIAHSGPLGGIKHNRPGWSTDEEDKEQQKFLQRRRGRQNRSRNQPTRTTF